MSKWKPGDLGVTAEGRLALRRENHSDGWIDSQGAPWSNDKFPTNVRPLVVIDPEDREQTKVAMAALWKALAEVTNGHPLSASATQQDDAMQAALRSLIAPEKPAEPMGLGAVVVVSGPRWEYVRTRMSPPWLCVINGERAAWDDLAVSEIQSEGVAL